MIVSAPRLPTDTELAPQLTHLTDIDGSSFPLEPPIGTIEDMTSDSSGTIYISDRVHSHIVMTDVEGRYLGKIGQKGPGPYEISTTPPSIWIAWTDEPGILAVNDLLRKILFFRKDGTFLNSRITEGIQRVLRISAFSGGIIGQARENPPFVVFDFTGNRISSFGRYMDPEDTPWRAIARQIAEDEITDYPPIYGGVRVAGFRTPHRIGIVADSLLIHDLCVGNGYRAWDLRTGQFVWQLDLTETDFEPPTLIRYKTSYTGPNASWDRGGPGYIQDRSLVMSIDYQSGWIITTVRLLGNGTRKKPDRIRVTNPYTSYEEAGMRDWPVHGVLEVISMEPDLIAHLSFHVQETFVAATVVPGPMLVLAFEEPAPRLSVFTIDGLPDG